jgi:hypothetical protein
MEANQNQMLKGIKPNGIQPNESIEWESNRKPNQNGIKPKPRFGEMSQTENRNRMESTRNQELKGVKPKTEIEWKIYWNQTRTNS